MDTRRRQELVAIAALVAGAFVGLTLLPWHLTGPIGTAVGRLLWEYLGIGAGLIPVFFVGLGLAGLGRLRRLDMLRAAVLFAGVVLLAPYAIALATGARETSHFPPDYADWLITQRLVGVIPALLAVGVTAVVGTAGAVLVGVLALSALTLVTLDWHPFRRLAGGGGRDVPPALWEEPGDGPPIDAAAPPAPSRRRARGRKAAAVPAGGPSASPEALPPIDLLAPPKRDGGDIREDEIDQLGEVLIHTLRTFRVEGQIVGRTTGPVVTQYEVAPAPGVKVGRIAALADDLALAMRAASIRILAPIPGKAAVGVEVPNPTAQMVGLREMLEAPEWERARAALPIALGRNLEGRPIVADLAKMPHLLIAGATGSGKSVCINAIITSLVYRYLPQDLRMLMIDPKMVELSGYNTLPHLRHPVVTNNRQAAQALKWAMFEMERRYVLFHANSARNIYDFNRKVVEGKRMVMPGGAVARAGRSAASSGAEADGAAQVELPLPYEEGPLPYVVVIVDELADLMMTVQAEVEKPLAILAQKARATGIHLILATQRPSVNVITGLIKANFPSRIAFRVASKVDSRTIIDQNGAETLLGNGDMLFLPPGRSEPIRIQGAFIGTEETERVTDWFAARVRPAAHEDDILEVVEAVEAEEQVGGTSGAAGSDRDALFREAAETCIQNQLGSTSLLQRKLRIGYGRAARIIDQLYEAGVIGPPDGSKPREVLVGMEDLDRLG